MATRDRSSDRHLARLCSDCWYIVRPTEYFPDRPTADGECCGCGWYSGGIVRVSRAEAAEVAAEVYADPADRPSCRCHRPR